MAAVGIPLLQMKEFGLFLKAVFWRWQSWAGGSGIGGAIVVLLAIWDRLIPQHPVSNRMYVAITIIGFLTGAFFLAWRDQYRARIAAEQVPTELTLNILDFHHRPETGDATDKSLHIFVKASVELMQPKKAEVFYKLSLVFPDRTAEQTSIDDIELWGMRVQDADSSGHLTSVTIHCIALDALPTNFVARDKKEGWLHFKFIPPTMEIFKSARVRLTALTPHGGNHDEQVVVDERWPLLGRPKSIVKMRTEEWLTLPEAERRLRLGRFGEYGGDIK